jgi:Flp pilus assembly pilin Flp
MYNRLLKFGMTFYREEEAATTVEYALLVALIIIFSISAILGTGDVQKALWFDTADELQVIAPN